MQQSMNQSNVVFSEDLQIDYYQRIFQLDLKGEAMRSLHIWALALETIKISKKMACFDA